METKTVLVLMLIVLSIVLYNQNSLIPQDNQETNDNQDIYQQDNVNSLVSPKVAFSASNLFLTGQSISSQYVRIFELNGNGWKDLGAKAMDGSTTDVQPNYNYKFYYFMDASDPSRAYYPYVKEYTAPERDSVDNLVGKGCTIDTSPHLTTYNDLGQIQSQTANAVALTTNDVKDVSLKIKAANDKCFGTPQAKKDNIVCFGYDSTKYDLIKAETGFVSTPASVVENTNASSLALKCYNFPVLEDLDEEYISVTIDVAAANPGTGDDILVFADDIALDINAYNSQEIWGYVDEDGNQLGMNATLLGVIEVS